MKGKNEKMDVFILGHVGRFSYQKNHEFLIDVFHNIYASNDKTRLLLIGQGELENEIYDKIYHYGLENVICHIKGTPNVNQYMQAMDAFLFPSRYEGLGIAAIEAQAAGLPMIISDKVPKDTYLTDLVYVCPIDQGVKIWEDVIHEIMKKKVERKKYAYAVKEGGYSIEETARELEKVYDENL